MVLNKDTAKQAFKEKLNEQVEYQKISRAFDVFFEHEQNYNKQLETMKETIEKTHLNVLSALNQDYISINQDTQQDLNQYEQTNKEHTLEAQKQYKLQLKTIEENFITEKEKLELAIDQENVFYQGQIKKEQNELSKTLSATNKAISEIKKTYENHVRQIEFNHQNEKNELKLNFQDHKNDIHKHLLNIEKNYQDERTHKLALKTTASTSHDQDYILIKTYYNELTKHLNTQINSLKKYFAKTKQDIINYYDQKKKPVEQEIQVHEQKKVEAIALIKKTLEEALASINQKQKQFEESYQLKKRKLMTQTAESVSTLNSKLSNFRELTNAKKQAIIKAFHKQEKESKRAEVSQKNKKLLLLDEELNQLILKTKKLIKEKKIEGQLLLFEHEKAYHQTLAKLTFDRKHALMSHELDIKHVHLTLAQHRRHIQDRLNRIDLEAHSLIDLLQVHYDHEMHKYETQVTLASETQERDLSQLTQDAYIDVTYFDIDIEKHDFQFQTEKHMVDHQLETLQLNETHEIDLNNLKQTRELEKESLIRDLKLEEQSLRESLASHIFERKQKEIDVHHSNRVDSLKHDLDKLEYAFNYDLRHAKYKLNHFITNQRHDIEKKQVIINQRLREQSLDRSLSIMKESLEHYANKTKHMYKALFLNITQIQQLNVMLNDFYHTPAHPDALRTFFTFFASVMTQYKQTYQHTFEAYQKQMIHDYKLYIKDLMDTIRHIKYKDFDDEKMYLLEENTLKVNHIDESLLSLQSSMKTLKTKSREFKKLEKEYHLRMKQKESVMLQYKKIEKTFEHKKIAYDKSLNVMTKTHMRYLKKLNQTLDASLDTMIHYFETQQSIIDSMQKSLYMSDSILTTSLKNAEKIEKIYTQKLNFHQQQLFETLMLHYQLLHSLIQNEKNEKTSNKELDIQTLQSKNDLLNEKHDHMMSTERRQFRRQLVYNKQQLEYKMKQRIDDSEASNQVLSKRISKQELTLQNLDQSFESSLSYHDINTRDTISQNMNAYQLKLSDVTLKQQQSIHLLSKAHLHKLQSLESSVTSTEQHIESRLVKYRAFVSKKRESLKVQTQTYVHTLSKHDRLLKHKRIQAKRKTKKLLQTIKYEKRRYVLMKMRSERRLKKSYEQRQAYMQKLVTRSHKFKMRVMTFS